jgi:hypothetical protein
MSDTRSPDLDARLSEDVEKAAKALYEFDASLNDRSIPWGDLSGEYRASYRRKAVAVLSAANHAERLAENERARLWIGYAMEEMTAEQITRVTERAEYEGESLLDRVRVLEEALKFYADESNWTLKSVYGAAHARHWCGDGGKQARRALASSLETDTADGGRG